MASITRFIALGDSLTEGLSDKYPDGSYRGWADRVADVLAGHSSDFEYANFAIRGKLLEQVAEHQVPLALDLIEGQNTLVTFHAGANNVLRPGFEPESVSSTYRQAVAKISEKQPTLLLFTVREVSNPKTKTQHYWNQRFGPFNENVKRVAAEFGATVMDANSREVFGDPRMLAKDRLHLSTEGHRRVAAAVLSAIQMPHDADWQDPMSPYKPAPVPVRVVGSVAWGVAFLVPWAIRRITRKSSGDGRVAKHSELVTWSPRI
ncbi:MAG: SGNH/GDSL hydrolase family protein [Actinobacteria bacterium]|nr:SGNH/GDSL hydrolase family protein [Actinomycetota bacterium]